MDGLESRKLQELLSYLLVFSNRAHLREFLADLIWGESNQSRKYLRQAIWNLKRLFQSQRFDEELLVVSPDWIQMNSAKCSSLDVAILDTAFARVKGRSGDELVLDEVAELEAAVSLYRGELLEGFYQDWCLFERQRVKALYLRLLEKLIYYYESIQRFEEGLQIGQRLLCAEPAHERTHRQMMRMYYLSGDRTLAIRQFQSCRKALNEHLDVEPSANTLLLYDRIRAEEAPSDASGVRLTETAADGHDLLNDLHEARRLLSGVLASVEGRTHS